MLTEEQAQRIAAVMADRQARWKMSPGEALETIEVLLEDRAELVAENAKYREAYWRARACGSVETCHAECWDCMFPPRED